jgi:hypothetical protein
MSWAMDQTLDNEYWISWILADYTPLLHNNLTLFLSSPSRECKFLAEDIFLQSYRAALEDGALSEDEINALLIKYDLWNNDKEKNLDRLIKDTENVKVQMFENWSHPAKLSLLRGALAETTKEINRNMQDKQMFDQVGAKSVAMYSRQHFTVGCSIYKSRTKPYWKNPLRCWTLPDEILAHAYKTLNKYILTEWDYRELARSSTWRNIWNARKGVGNVFGKAAIDLSVQQKHLISWSQLYDNVYKHSDAPPDEVVNDNDILDGWMIAQKRKRDSEMNRVSVESSITNKKIWGCEEVFILVDDVKIAGTTEDKFNAIYNMNDVAGKVAFKRRMSQIEKDGIVEENNMIDRRIELQQAIVRKGLS